MAYPKVLLDLINSFRKLPGIGEKSAERLALSVLDMTLDDVNNFSSSKFLGGWYQCSMDFFFVKIVDSTTSLVASDFECNFLNFFGFFYLEMERELPHSIMIHWWGQVGNLWWSETYNINAQER